MDPTWTPQGVSGRAPVLARRVVATSQPLAAQVGLRMLERGGNAVDAAIATAAMLTVVEPTANGLGGDAFALLWVDGRLRGFNGSGRSPRCFLPERFEGRASMPRWGWESVTVPGAVSLWVELARFGRLPLRDLLSPAIEAAQEGFVVGPGVAEGWARAAELHGDRPDWRATFAPEGPPAAGELVRLPDHASTLRSIAESGGESFYRGPLAERVVRAAREAGVPWTPEDLATHRCEEVRPLALPVGDVVLHELPPNGQGLAAALAVGLLERLRPDGFGAGPLAASELHLQVEAMKSALADAHRHLADPASMPRPAESFLAEGYLRRRAAEVGPRAGRPAPGDPGGDSTVYLATADADGGLVSLIQSNYEGFGSGIVVPGTGIAMQNRAAGFVLEAGHPNRVGPGKRPFHTIIPALLTREGAPHAAFGVMGGPMQPQGHLQVLARLLAGEDPQAALDAPRWRTEPDGRLLLEPGFAPEVVRELKRRGHRVEEVGSRCVRFGGGQVVLRLASGAWAAGSDPRRDGQAVGS